ncbi:hypothetical protein DBR06_SOUSAS32010003, partial [Sousa chinensis]
LSCRLAFIVKIPLNGLELRLPKVQVEASIEKSRGLSGMLLQL